MKLFKYRTKADLIIHFKFIWLYNYKDTGTTLTYFTATLIVFNANESTQITFQYELFWPITAFYIWSLESASSVEFCLWQNVHATTSELLCCPRLNIQPYLRRVLSDTHPTVIQMFLFSPRIPHASETWGSDK